MALVLRFDGIYMGFSDIHTCIQEHATAFLTKVAKRDAPDYYDVIKNPMDLGTMMRNVRQGRFKSKAQFMRDLDLIWDNCLTYNSEPVRPERHYRANRRKQD